MRKDIENNYILSNVLYSHLAIILQLYNIYFVVKVITNELDLKLCFLDEARFVLIIVHAINFSFITGAALLKQFKPNKYSDLSLTMNYGKLFAGKIVFSLVMFLLMKHSCGWSQSCSNETCLDTWVKCLGLSLLVNICLHGVILVDVYWGWRKMAAFFFKDMVVPIGHLNGRSYLYTTSSNSIFSGHVENSEYVSVTVGFWTATCYMMWSVVVVGVAHLLQVPVFGFIDFLGLLVNAIYPFCWIFSNKKLSKFAMEKINFK